MFKRIMLPATVTLFIGFGVFGSTSAGAVDRSMGEPARTPHRTPTVLPTPSPSLAPTPAPDEPMSPTPTPSPSPTI